jgi:ankyrin repeat protein
MKALAPCIVEPGTPPKQEQARRERKRQIVELLLTHGADVAQSDQYGMTALHIAAHTDEDEGYLAAVIARFLKLGATPDPATRFGVTPLMLAAERDRARVVAVLLKAGANPTAKMESGETALSIAQKKGYRAVALLLEGVAKSDAGQR